MLDEILKALKNKYENLGFTEKAFGAVADFLLPTVTEESQIEGAINGVEPLLKGFQGDVDKRVADAIIKTKLEVKKDPKEQEKKPAKTSTKTGVAPETGEEKKDDEQVPAWAKLLIDQNMELKEEVLNMKAGKAAETRKQKLESILENAPESLKTTVLKDFGRMKFDTDEDFETYLTEKKTDCEAFSKELTEKGLGAITKPGGLPKPGEGGSAKEASKEEVAAVLNLLI